LYESGRAIPLLESRGEAADRKILPLSAISKDGSGAIQPFEMAAYYHSPSEQAA
jgi:hypothetical protein